MQPSAGLSSTFLSPSLRVLENPLVCKIARLSVPISKKQKNSPRFTSKSRKNSKNPHNPKWMYKEESFSVPLSKYEGRWLVMGRRTGTGVGVSALERKGSHLYSRRRSDYAPKKEGSCIIQTRQRMLTLMIVSQCRLTDYLHITLLTCQLGHSNGSSFMDDSAWKLLGK